MANKKFCTVGKECFNPCYSGLQRIIELVGYAVCWVNVLILVIVDYSGSHHCIWDSWRYYVLILVIVDYSGSQRINFCGFGLQNEVLILVIVDYSGSSADGIVGLAGAEVF